MTDPGKVDWPELITDLIRAGRKQSVMAQEIGISRTSIVMYRNRGITPLHQTGERLIALWCESTHRGRDQVPKIVSNAVTERVNTLNEVVSLK